MIPEAFRNVFGRGMTRVEEVERKLMDEKEMIIAKEEKCISGQMSAKN